MPNNIMGNMRKNSGNLNGVSADDESSDSDHEYFVYKNYLIGLLRIKIFIIRIFKQFNLIFVFIYCAFIQQRIFFKFLSIEFLISLILFISTQKKNEPKKEDVEEKPANDDDEESLSSLSNESG